MEISMLDGTLAEEFASEIIRYFPNEQWSFDEIGNMLKTRIGSNRMCIIFYDGYMAISYNHLYSRHDYGNPNCFNDVINFIDTCMPFWRKSTRSKFSWGIGILRYLRIMPNKTALKIGHLVE